MDPASALQHDLNHLNFMVNHYQLKNNLPIIVFNMNVEDNLKELLSGKNIGTLIC